MQDLRFGRFYRLGIEGGLMLMYPNEVYSLNFICTEVWLASGTDWISVVSP